ncbi:MAG: hypothetical protein R2760_00130 [Chitinophagales bacterium]
MLKTGDIYDRPVLDSTIYRISHFCYDLMGKPSEHDCDSTLLFNKKNVLTNQLNLYPNPSNGIFNIEMPKSLVMCQTILLFMIQMKISIEDSKHL